jgi:hypothetical protein
MRGGADVPLSLSHSRQARGTTHAQHHRHRAQGGKARQRARAQAPQAADGTPQAGGSRRPQSVTVSQQTTRHIAGRRRGPTDSQAHDRRAGGTRRTGGEPGPEGGGGGLRLIEFRKECRVTALIAEQSAHMRSEAYGGGGAR